MDRLHSDELVDRLEDLPPLPDSCVRLQALVNDPNASAKDIARVIESDAAVAGRVLRMANSAHLAVPGGVTSLPRAVTMLGLSAIHQVALCLHSQRLLGRNGRPPPEWLTQHAMAVAILAGEVALRTGAVVPQAVTAPGLLHDLGRLAGFALFAPQMNHYLDAIAAGAPHGVESEREILGVDHETVGAALARRWDYPEALVRVIGAHHAPRGEVEDMVEGLVDVIAVADAWAADLGFPGLPGGRPDLEASRGEALGIETCVPEGDRAPLLEAVSAQALAG